MPRPRSARAHEQVLEAASNLFAERGIDRASMDAVAETSGVSKATIYKHWADKEALLLDVMARLNGLDERPSFDTGNPARDLAAVLSYRPPDDRAEQASKISPHLIAYATQNPKFGQTWRSMVLEPPRREIRQILERGIREGRFPPSLDIELSLAILLGPMLYNHIFGRKGAKPLVSKRDPDAKRLALQVADSFCRAFALTPKPAHSRSGRKQKL